MEAFSLVLLGSDARLAESASDALCTRDVCASAGVQCTPTAQLGGAASICKASCFAVVVVATLCVLVMLLVLALVVLVLAAVDTLLITCCSCTRSLRVCACCSGGRQHHLVLCCEWRTAVREARPRQPRGRVWPRTAAAALRPGARAGRARHGLALRRLAGRGAPRVRWR